MSYEVSVDPVDDARTSLNYPVSGAFPFSEFARENYFAINGAVPLGVFPVVNKLIVFNG